MLKDGEEHHHWSERTPVVTRGIDWGSSDVTGGPVDEVFAALRRSFADLKIERLTVAHPADDDNVWFITRGTVELQIDSMPDGAPPFLLESESERERAEDADAAIERLTEWLRA
jgi:hypothetical protein